MIMENERSERKRNCRMPQSEGHPEKTELRTAWPSFTQQLSKPISFLLSEHHGQPHPTQFLLANAGAPKPSLTLLKFLLACLWSALLWTITKKTPRSGNCLLTAFQLQLKWTLGSETEAGLSLRIVSHHITILCYPHTSLKTSHKRRFLHSNIWGIKQRCPLSFKHSSFEKVIIN